MFGALVYVNTPPLQMPRWVHKEYQLFDFVERKMIESHAALAP